MWFKYTRVKTMKINFLLKLNNGKAIPMGKCKFKPLLPALKGHIQPTRPSFVNGYLQGPVWYLCLLWYGRNRDHNVGAIWIFPPLLLNSSTNIIKFLFWILYITLYQHCILYPINIVSDVILILFKWRFWIVLEFYRWKYN